MLASVPGCYWNETMIRQYRDQDLEVVLDIYLAAATAGQPFLPAEFWENDIPVIRDELMPIAETWVVDADGEVLAFISVLDNVIGGLFTRPDHQGRGHGRALVEYVRERVDPLFVEVFEANHDAVDFYRNRGFVDHAARQNKESGLTELILQLKVV
jgi:putative acetyltransferase